MTLAPVLTGLTTFRMVGKPEVMMRIGSAGITSGLSVTRSEQSKLRDTFSNGMDDQTARAVRRGERGRAALPHEAPASARQLQRLVRPGAAPYGFQGADFDSLMARLLVFNPPRLFLGAGAPNQLE